MSDEPTVFDPPSDPLPGSAAETFPGQFDHEHHWSDWFPWDRRRKYRYCRVKFCPALEKVEVKA